MGIFRSWFFKRLSVVLDIGAYMPERAHNADAGYDIRTPKGFTIPAYGSTVVDTGVHVEIPRGWYGCICNKSGLSMNKGVMANLGVVDSGYTGSMRVRLTNDTPIVLNFERGDKIAQIIFIRHGEPKLTAVGKLRDTERGDNGFGSTGR